jgi:hypothetical protein
LRVYAARNVRDLPKINPFAKPLSVIKRSTHQRRRL